MEKPRQYDQLFDRVRRDWDAHDKTCQSMEYFWLGHTGGVSCPTDLTDCDGCRVTFYNEGVEDINWNVPDADPDYRCECCRRTDGAGASACPPPPATTDQKAGP